MNLIKQELNAPGRVVLKHDASVEDVLAEANRLRDEFGYDIEAVGQQGACKLSHPFFRGVFLLKLEPERYGTSSS